MFILDYLFQLLILFWILRSAKFILFYLYLWQLKNYHIGRFSDHFRTEKGKSLIYNRVNSIKVILLLYFFVLPYLPQYAADFIYPLLSFQIAYLVLYYLLPISLLLIYFLEGLKFMFDFVRGKVKFPALTKKVIFFLLLAFTLLIGTASALLYLEKELSFLVLWLLIGDLFLPFFISVLVLFFQPITVILRWKIIWQAKRKRASMKDLLVIGITGSYGKTSTKEFLYAILSKKFNVLKTSEHQNSEIGISRCILDELRPEHEIFIVEMGAYSRGGIKLLCNIVKPRIGILTGISEQHLALFGSQRNIMRGKYELIESLGENGLAFFNGDNEYCLELYNQTSTPKKIFVSGPGTLDFSPDIWAENVILQKDYIMFEACLNSEKEKIKAYLSGTHFVLNLLAAIGVAKTLGMTLKEISEAIFKIDSPQNTMNIFEGIKGTIIIDDTYSSNPEGVIAALNHLNIYGGKKMIIMPCLIELGKASRDVHYRIGEKIGETCEAFIVTTKDYFRAIGEGFLRKGGKEENAIFTDNLKEILEIIYNFWGPGDVILLEGRVPEGLLNSLVKK